MGTKRSHSEANGETAGHKRSHGHHGKPWAKRPKTDAGSDEKLVDIKKRARALERLLALDNTKIPADKLNDLQRELAAHKQRIAEARAKKHRSYMIKKYHMVRFFERQKATRLAKQLRKRINETEDTEEKAQLQADLHIAEVDLDYAIYYPFLEPYVSLYAKADSKEKPTAAQVLHAPRPPLWATIEKLRDEGKDALEKLQNRQSEPAEQPKASRPPKTGNEGETKASGAHKRKSAQRERSGERKEGRRHAEPRKEEDSDSDGGGFFEED